MAVTRPSKRCMISRSTRVQNKCSGSQTLTSDFKHMLDLKDQGTAYFKFKDMPKAATDIQDQIDIVLRFYESWYILN